MSENKYYDYLLSFNMNKPAKKNIDEIYSFNLLKSFDPKKHEFYNSEIKIEKVLTDASKKIEDPLSLQNILNLIQFITKYWDPFRNPNITLLWVIDNKDVSKEKEIFEQLFVNVNLVIYKYSNILPEIKNEIFLFWDNDRVLEDSFLARIEPIFLQITMRDDILQKYGGLFWDGRIYFSIQNNNSTRLVTSCIQKKIKYYPDKYKEQISLYYSFLASISFVIKSPLYHVVGLSNDWGSMLTINILKEYIEKTRIDGKEFKKASDEDIYDLIRGYFLTKKTNIRRYVDVVRNKK